MTYLVGKYEILRLVLRPMTKTKNKITNQTTKNFVRFCWDWNSRSLKVGTRKP